MPLFPTGIGSEHAPLERGDKIPTKKKLPAFITTMVVLLATAGLQTGYAQEPASSAGDGGERTCAGILYAPSHDDNPEWRAEVFDILGKRVDYWDARVSTPTIEDLQEYCCVLTWTNYAYDDKDAFSSVLTDYVDGGGILILGQWSYFGFGGGSIPAEILWPEYCPVTVSSYGVGTYSGDGTDCVHTGGLVSAYQSNYIDHLTLNPGAMSDGTIVESGLPAVAWRPDRHVYYSAGNTGGTFTTGDTAQLVANLYVCGGDPPYGACCDPATGECEDDVLLPFCHSPREAHPGQTCATMDPPCGNPGCCCNEELFTRSVEFEDNCLGRFIPGVTGAACLEDDPFEPPCRPFHCEGILYAPANPDNPEWRAELAAITGGPVDYWDARASTPTIDDLFPYCCVFTWVNYAYADRFAMGDVLADYVDGGGKVILGQWCYDVSGGMQGLQGRIMTPEYCPAIATSYGVGTYAGNGTDCVHTSGPVTAYASNYVDRLVLNPGAQGDGTLVEDETLTVAWRPDRRVYYSAGNTGGTLTSGDTAQLVANMCACMDEFPNGACCDPSDGVCMNGATPELCPPPLQFHSGAVCEMLDPPCGNPGCCCDDETGTRSEEFEANCSGRFLPGVLGAACMDEDPFDPPCNPACHGLLYAPTQDDNPAWRLELAGLLNSRVVYWDARVSTPTLEQLQEYCCVFTWTNYAYADRNLFGEVLADYVDSGGRVILGQWSWAGFDGSSIPAKILWPQYCPVTVSFYGAGAYAGDGTDCVHTTGPVTSYASSYVDRMTLNPGAEWDGTIEGEDTPIVAWRPDRRVYYSAGNTGGDITTGDTAQLVANMYFCSNEQTGACCESLSGTCVDNVTASQCQPPLSFYPNGTCALIDPPCGEDCDGNGISDSDQMEYTDTALFLDQLLADTPDFAYVCLFDCNGDFTLDGQDIQGFIARLMSAS